MPREVVFCTQKYQGIGFKHMYDLQGTDGVRLLLQELNFKEGSTNKMIRVLLEVIQQEAGIQAPILEKKIDPYSTLSGDGYPASETSSTT